jgi:Domain of unknown function (DUF4406)
MPKRIYIAGPMSGYPGFNFPAFNTAAAKFEADGWCVFNPADKEGEDLSDESFATGDHVQATKDGFDFRKGYTWGVNKVIEADAIYMMTGWEASAGARGEHAVAVATQKHYPDYQIIYETKGT